jgi:pimeloyl-ACP methyl ester carboxylesterase
MRRLRQTSPFLGPDGQVLPGSIAEVSMMRLGGLEQWVMIRGQRRENPVLVMLHGGPGFNSTRQCRTYNPVLETLFTVVYWDQRGAGRSFDPSIPRASMTVEQFITDLDQLVDAVRERLGHERVVLFGHSWGSVLGPLYASRFPDKVALYVGCGQLGDWAKSEALAYAWTLAEARRQGNAKAVSELEALGEPPYSADALWTQRNWSQMLEGNISVGGLLKMARALVGTPEASLFDLRNIMRGFRFSLDAMWDEVSQIDLLARVPALKMPVVLLLGRKDRWVASEISQAFFDGLEAPHKEIVWFESSGHEPYADEPDAFEAAMRTAVLPAVGTARSG